MIKAILLAAGKSKRLKSENKLIKKFKNKALINHSLQALFKSKVDKIVIVLGYQNKEVRKVIKKNKKNIFVFNKNFRLGMSSSIKAGLKKISKKDKGFMIVQSDMPFIRTSVDHGTAFDIVGTQKISTSSFYEALDVAIQLSQ